MKMETSESSQKPVRHDVIAAAHRIIDECAPGLADSRHALCWRIRRLCDELKKLQDSAVRTQGVSNELFFCARVTGGIRKNHGPLGVVI